MPDPAVPFDVRVLVAVVLAAGLSGSAAGGTIEVNVRNERGTGVRDAVAYALPVGREYPPVRRSAEMDQKNRQFIPHVLVVQTGTAVEFPNRDDIHHHVYSFSPAKPFQLPLYKGTPANPVIFDRAGLVTIGCNIHDRMSAYIVVVDTPWFGKSEESGRILLRDVEPGNYTVHIWYPEMRGELEPARVTVEASSRTQLSYVTGSPRIE